MHDDVRVMIKGAKDGILAFVYSIRLTNSQNQANTSALRLFVYCDFIQFEADFHHLHG